MYLWKKICELIFTREFSPVAHRRRKKSDKTGPRSQFEIHAKQDRFKTSFLTGLLTVLWLKTKQKEILKQYMKWGHINLGWGRSAEFRVPNFCL